MSVTIRRAVADDAALMAQQRAAVWTEGGRWDADVLRAQTGTWTEWMRDAIESGTYVGFIAEESGAVAGSCGLLVHVALPRPHSPSDRTGRVQSMYVVPAYRRRGIARALMRELIAYARGADLSFLTLGTSEQARALYASLGFEARPEMMLLLQGGQP